MLLRLKHFNFQTDKIWMQALFTLNKLLSPWLSISISYRVWKHNQNDNFTQMYSDLMKFVLILCKISYASKYSKPCGDVVHIERYGLLPRLPLQ